VLPGSGHAARELAPWSSMVVTGSCQNRKHQHYCDYSF